MTDFKSTLDKLRQLPEWLWDQAFTRIENLTSDSDGTLRYAEQPVDASEGNLITSRVEGPADPFRDYDLQPMRILLDIDMPVYARETSPGKWHIAIDKVVTREQHNRIIVALTDAGILQRGFADSAVGSELGACLRPPWVSKDDLDEAKVTPDPELF